MLRQREAGSIDLGGVGYKPKAISAIVVNAAPLGKFGPQFRSISLRNVRDLDSWCALRTIGIIIGCKKNHRGQTKLTVKLDLA